MLASPDPAQPLYGPLYSLVTNGSSFLFLKLVQSKLRCAQSKPFELEDGDDLSVVLQILKQLATVMTQD
ncbi:MAG: hypothetical protein ACKO7W_19805 [Elainella sp.]